MRRILCVAFGMAAAFGQNAELAAKLDHDVAAYQKERQFIGSVLVAKGGKTILEKGYGMADIELDVPNSPATKFRLGSITKQFTAAAILQLEEQGKLSVNDLACKYFEGCAESWKQITIHQLLSHTSGIPSYTDEKNFATPEHMRIPLTPVQIVLLSKDKPLDFDPGTKWKYDNTGYVFLGAIIEKASGEKYAEYLRKHIFDPLGMADSGYDDTKTILKNRALGYRPKGDGFANAEYIDMTLPHAAGSLYSTVRDLAKWDRALYGDQVLSKASREKMFTAVKNDYGYGQMVGKMAGHKQIGHGGGINGFATYLARFPDDDAVVIVLSNNEAGAAGPIAGVLAAELFGQPVTLPGERKAITLDGKVLDRYVGSYQVGPLAFTLTNEGGHLMMAVKGQGKFEAFASSETEFFLKVVDATLTFTPDADGKGMGIRFQQGPADLTGKRTN